jgi:hypothetical protein
MKIALCISGQPRFIEESFPYIKKNIIDCNDNIDVFLHSWFSPDEVGKKFSNTSDTTREEGNGFIRSNTVEILKELYKPVSLLIETQEDFSHKIKPEYTAARDKTNPFATFSMWESIARCNNLKVLYELENSFTYDVVIRCRFDLKLETPLIIKTSDNATIHTSGYNINEKLVEDILFYASSNTMNRIVELPGMLDEHFSNINIWNNEQLLRTHCEVKNISVTRHREWKFTLARGKRTLKDSLWYYKNRIISKLQI